MDSSSCHVNSLNFNSSSTRRVNSHKVLPQLNCFYTNADQLHNKLTELEIRTQDNKPNIIGITEVKPKHGRYKTREPEYSLGKGRQYQMFSKNIENDTGRGLLLYVDQDLDATEYEPETQFEENLMVKINLNNADKLLVCLIYRFHYNKSQEYNKKLRDLIDEANSKNFSHILIMGDFNYPDIDWDSWNSKGDSTDTIEYKFIDNLQDNYAFQHIKKATRWRGDDIPSILDLIITNEEGMVTDLEYSSPLGKSDHCVVNFKFNCYANLKNTSKVKRQYHKGKYEEFNKAIKEKEWNNIIKSTANINENWNSFLEEIKKMEDIFIPKKKNTNNNKKKNTFPVDQTTREKIRKKNNLARRITRNHDPMLRQEYNKLRNKVKAAVKKLRKKYEKDLSKQAKRNPKVIWSYIKSKLKTRDGIGELHTDPEDTKSPKTSSDEEKANILANFFTSVFTNEPDGEIPRLPNKVPERPMPSLSITEEDIRKLLENLKIDKSPGLDELHTLGC